MKKNYRLILPLILIFAASYVFAGERAPIAEGETPVPPFGGILDAETCVKIALEAHPSVAFAGHNVAAARSRVSQAESDYYPEVEVSSGYSRVDIASSAGTDPRNEYSNAVSLRQNIYDFGRTSEEIKVRKRNLGSLSFDLEDARNKTAFNVRQAYYKVLLAIKNKIVQEETVKQFKQRLEQAKGFFELGKKPKFDVTRASVALSDAGVNLIKAENALRIARVNLKNAMGITEAPDFEIKDDLEFKRYVITMEEAVEKAIAGRPDLKSAFEKKQSTAEGVELAKKNYYPVLSGNASYNFSGESYPLDEGWNVGAVVTVPVFTGFLTKHQAEEARGKLGAAKADEELLRQLVIFETKQAYFNLIEAGERVPASELTVKQALENLELANARYSTGVGNPIEVTDATITYSNARLGFFQSLADYKTAEANLKFVTGER